MSMMSTSQRYVGLAIEVLGVTIPKCSQDTDSSQGGWAEHLLTHPDNHIVLDKYLTKCKDLGYVFTTHPT